MLWDDDYLYIGAVLEEEDIKARLTRRDTIIYYDNDFEVFIDPDSDGHNYFEIETNARGVIFDLMLDKPYRSGGNFMVQWDCPGMQMAVHCEGTLNKPKDKDKYWSVEMAIPHQAPEEVSFPTIISYRISSVASFVWRRGLSHRSPPRSCWASRNPPPSGPGRDSTARRAPGTAMTPW